ncbi:hypothetical protein [Aquabacterium sp. A08]|uniref:hypothetical protein n=1 Tax=Aquabacterium sp. A08 TaxID=2718532 RepID=UPI0014223809|nr:hypothetical protein [Aquabacterium sp. A08]NIC40260.1 hypothetical protein [Aquabacterium sp. A08]
MGVWGFVLHLLNFVAPAVAVAGLLSAAVVGPRGLALWGPRARRWARVWAVLAAVGVAVLLAGLVLHGRDGKMSTYAALVLATGSVAAWWRGRR